MLKFGDSFLNVGTSKIVKMRHNIICCELQACLDMFGNFEQLCKMIGKQNKVEQPFCYPAFQRFPTASPTGYGTTPTGYGTTQVWCRGVSRYVEGCWGVPCLKININNISICMFPIWFKFSFCFVFVSFVYSCFILYVYIYIYISFLSFIFQKCRYSGFQDTSNKQIPRSTNIFSVKCFHISSCIFLVFL